MKAIASWWARRFLLAELLLATLASASLIVASEMTGGGLLTDLLNDRREGLYSALTGLYGSLLGFALATAAIVLGYAASDRLKVIRESQHYSTLWKVFFSAIRVLSAATVASLVSLLVDQKDTAVGPIFYFSLFLATLVVLRVGRTIWILQRVVSLVTAPSKARQGDPA